MNTLRVLFIAALLMALAAQAPGASPDEGEALLREGIAFLDASDYPRSLEALEKSLARFRQANDARGAAQALLWLSRRSVELRKFDDAARSAGDCIAAAETLNDPALLFAARLALVDALFSRGKRGHAWELLAQLEPPPKGLPTESLADFYLLRGEMLLARDQDDLARKNFEEARRLSSAMNDAQRTALSLSRLARAHSSAKSFEKAFACALEAMEEAVGCGRPYLEGLLLEGQGDIRDDESRFGEARASYLAALAAFERCGNAGRKGRLLSKVARVCISESDWEKGSRYAWRALETHKASAEPGGQVESCRILLAILVFKPDPTRAQALKLALEELAEAQGSSEYGAEALLALGKLGRHILCDFPGAIESFREGGARFHALGETRGELKCLMEEGALLTRLGRYGDAHRVYGQAMALRAPLEETVREDDEEYFSGCSPGEILRRRGMLYLMESRYLEAMACYREALAKDASGERTYERVMDRHGLVMVHLYTYDYLAVEKEVTEAFSEIPTLKKPIQRAVLYNIIMTTLMPINRTEGLRAYEKKTTFSDSLDRMVLDRLFKHKELVKTILGAYRDWIRAEQERKSTMNEGFAWLFQGLFFSSGRMDPETEDSYRHALDLFKKSGVANWEGLTRFFIARWHLERGRTSDALAAAKDALEAYERGGVKDGQMYALSFMGTLRKWSGEHDEALRCIDRALVIARELSSPRNELSLLVGRGSVLYAKSEYGASLASFQSALALLEKTPDRELEGAALAFAARNLSRLGRTREAIESERKAFRIFTALGAVFEARDVALELGALLEESKMTGEALEVYREALDDFTGLRENLPAGTERQLSEQKETAELFERAIVLLVKEGRHDEALRYIELSHSQEVLSSLDLETVTSGDPKMKESLAKLQELRRKLSLLRKEVEGSGDGQKREYLSRILASTRQEFLSTLNEIHGRDPDIEQLLSVQGAQLAQIQQVLPAETLLLEYYPAKDALYILVVKRDGFSIRAVGVGRERLYTLVRRMRELITTRGDARELAETGGILYSFLVEPVKDEMATKERIAVIPGGLLWYLPLEVLGKPAQPCLLEERDVSYVSSSDIMRIVAGRKGGGETPVLVAFGDPQGADLPGAGDEVRALGKIFPSARIFTGADATALRFRAEAPGATLLHIASHSALDTKDINKSFIQFADPEGALHLGEIYGLPLDKVSLVTLSSCESALGDENPGREIASLATAFTTAGAESVVASLWRVEDKATTELITEFYRALAQGETTARALRKAKLKVMRNPATAHPFYWGAFILMGDPR